MAQLRWTPPVEKRTMGQLLGIAWLAWILDRRYTHMLLSARKRRVDAWSAAQPAVRQSGQARFSGSPC